jgi:DNA-binding HxlR family transcriptional regulator
VLWELHGTEAATFRVLQERCGGLSSSVLADRLAELTQAQIVHRTETGYSLTADGHDLVKDVMVMEKWATRWAERMRDLEADAQ